MFLSIGTDAGTVIFLLLFIMTFIASVTIFLLTVLKDGKNGSIRKVLQVILPYAANVCFYAAALPANLKLTGKSFGVQHIYKILAATVDGLKFVINDKVIVGGYTQGESLYSLEINGLQFINNPAFSTVMVWLYLISIALFYAGITVVIFKAVINSIMVKQRLRYECDILYGELDYRTYAKGHKETVLWIEPSISKEDEDEIKRSGIAYVKKPFTPKALGSVLKHKSTRKFKREYYNTSLGKLYASLLSRVFKGRADRKYNIIILGDEERSLKAIYAINQFLDSKNGQPFKNTEAINIYAEVSYDSLQSVRNNMAQFGDISNHVNIINRYELLGLKFNLDYPITRFMDRSLIDDEKHYVKEDCNINVFYVGFGKVNKAIHAVSLINDILPTAGRDEQSGDKLVLKEKKINYYAGDLNIFDQASAKEGDEDGYLENVFNASLDEFMNPSYKKEAPNKDDYYAYPDPLPNLRSKELDANSKEFLNSIATVLSRNQAGYNRIIISLNDNVGNLDYAQRLIAFLKQRNIYSNTDIFVRIKDYDADVYRYIQDDKLYIFGSNEDVLNHDVIIRDDLYYIARVIHENYEQNKMDKKNWIYTGKLEQASNLCSAMNIRVKLNLLGYDIHKGEESKKSNLESARSFLEFNERYGDVVNLDNILSYYKDSIKSSRIYDFPVLSENIDSYAGRVFHRGDLLNSVSKFKRDYQKVLVCNPLSVGDNYSFDSINSGNIVSFQEHARWNAFHLSRGFIPFPKNDINVVLPTDNIFKKDDKPNLRHACLCTFYDLDLYHNRLVDLLLEPKSSNDAKSTSLALIKESYGIEDMGVLDNGNGYYFKIVNSNSFKRIITEHFLEFYISDWSKYSSNPHLDRGPIINGILERLFNCTVDKKYTYLYYHRRISDSEIKANTNTYYYEHYLAKDIASYIRANLELYISGNRSSYIRVLNKRSYLKPLYRIEEYYNKLVSEDSLPGYDGLLKLYHERDDKDKEVNLLRYELSELELLIEREDIRKEKENIINNQITELNSTIAKIDEEILQSLKALREKPRRIEAKLLTISGADVNKYKSILGFEYLDGSLQIINAEAFSSLVHQPWFSLFAYLISPSLVNNEVELINDAYLNKLGDSFMKDLDDSRIEVLIELARMMVLSNGEAVNYLSKPESLEMSDEYINDVIRQINLVNVETYKWDYNLLTIVKKTLKSGYQIERLK